MQPLAQGALGTFGLPQPMPLALVKITSVKIVLPSGIAKRLRPLTHGTPCETHIQKKAKIDPQEIEVQPVEEVIEESSQKELL